VSIGLVSSLNVLKHYLFLYLYAVTSEDKYSIRSTINCLWKIINIFKIWGRETSTARFNPMSNPHDKATVTFHAEHSFAKPKNYSASQEFPRLS